MVDRQTIKVTKSQLTHNVRTGVKFEQFQDPKT
jgi:hypothetical protein